MDVVIVESPAKAKTINKYLGPGYQVLASYGHVRDLPAKDGSVDPDDDFAMIWSIDGKAKQRMADIAKAVKNADRLILATDPDREGEAISWHMLQVLRDKKALADMPVERVVFNSVTKKAVQTAMANPRDIDEPLVNAYLARRALDYLVGFTLSPVLWRKLPGARSAGRVQSVALRLVCEREADIERFIPQEYWSVRVNLATPSGDAFQARIAEINGKKLTRLSITGAAEAKAIVDHLEAADFTVSSVESKPQRRNPQPPFTTSTLQQEAQRKLGFDAARTMQVAQRLYEGIDLQGETVGLITYMRTDGVDIEPDALSGIRGVIGSDFGDRYLPQTPRRYHAKAKNAQEAHEAIRPTDARRALASVASFLDRDQARLYELIWKRTLASQMESAEMERTTVDIEARANGTVASLRANGSVIRFDGFLALYQEGRDDAEDEESGRLPAMSMGDRPTPLAPDSIKTEQAEGETAEKAIQSAQHFTEPPPRFTEASLIKKMEELGIGRPSTYASTMAVLRDRDYVHLDKKRIAPQDKGRLVTAFLESFFNRYVQYDFTAGLEEKLDRISAGELAWKDVLRDFWRDFSASVDDIKELRVTNVLDALNEILSEFAFPAPEGGGDPRGCPLCEKGQLSLKLGRYGAFIGCSNYPECRFTRQLGDPNGNDPANASPDGKILGEDPETGLTVALKSGRFGPYVQLGLDPEKGGEKPNRGSLPKEWAPDDINLEKALKLLSLPRPVGDHPETSKPITAGLGRYGPFVAHDGQYASLDGIDEVFTVGENRAIALLAEKKSRGGRRNAPAALKELGEHPELGGVVTVRDGRYGPYINHGKINATLQKGIEPLSVTLAQAVEMIAEKAAKGGTKRKKPTRKKAPAKKKTTAKKAPAKTAKAAD